VQEIKHGNVRGFLRRIQCVYGPFCRLQTVNNDIIICWAKLDVICSLSLYVNLAGKHENYAFQCNSCFIMQFFLVSFDHPYNNAPSRFVLLLTSFLSNGLSSNLTLLIKAKNEIMKFNISMKRLLLPHRFKFKGKLNLIFGIFAFGLTSRPRKTYSQYCYNLLYLLYLL
jgi:hypothetical protein